MSRPDYGQDAPGVVRNLLLAGAAGIAIWAGGALGIEFLRAVTIHLGSTELRIELGPMGLTAGIAFLVTGIWMVGSSRVGKIGERERLLDRVDWKGGERVLDVGCGRGLLLVGAARRLTSGLAVGIDIWSQVDLGGNRPRAPLENARREGVEGRVVVATADMRRLPFPAGTFDLIVSRAAIHNLYESADRRRAIEEIARVLEPGGTAVISDIRHIEDYARAFGAKGCRETGPRRPRLGAWAAALITFGSLRPGVLVVRKEG